MTNKKDIISQDGQFHIQIIGGAEPNNGRMLWEVVVHLKGSNITPSLFENEWNYINSEINNLEISDSENKFYYVPAESKSKLIRKSDGQIIELKYQGISTARFLGNKFSKNYLLEIFNDEITITDLNSFNNQSFKPEEGEWINNAEFIDPDTITIDLIKVEDNNRIKRSTTMTIKHRPNQPNHSYAS